MNEISTLITQMIAIKEQNNVSIGQIMVRTDNKYSKGTISHLMSGATANPNLETFVDVCSALGARLVLQTETSENAEIRDSIEEYRINIVEKCEEIEALQKKIESTIDYYKKKIAERDSDVTKMRGMLDRKDEQVSTLIDACRRKDERLNELGIRLEFWGDKENKEKFEI